MIINELQIAKGSRQAVPFGPLRPVSSRPVSSRFFPSPISASRFPPQRRNGKYVACHRFPVSRFPISHAALSVAAANVWLVTKAISRPTMFVLFTAWRRQARIKAVHDGESGVLNEEGIGPEPDYNPSFPKAGSHQAAELLRQPYIRERRGANINKNHRLVP